MAFDRIAETMRESGQSLVQRIGTWEIEKNVVERFEAEGIPAANISFVKEFTRQNTIKRLNIDPCNLFARYDNPLNNSGGSYEQ